MPRNSTGSRSQLCQRHLPGYSQRGNRRGSFVLKKGRIKKVSLTTGLPTSHCWPWGCRSWGCPLWWCLRQSVFNKGQNATDQRGKIMRKAVQHQGGWRSCPRPQQSLSCSTTPPILSLCLAGLGGTEIGSEGVRSSLGQTG